MVDDDVVFPFRINFHHANHLRHSWFISPEVQLSMSKIAKSGMTFSDEEEVPTLNWRDVSSDCMPFGKFKGQSFKEIVSSKNGRDYLRWVHKALDLRPMTSGKIHCTLEWYHTKKMSRANSVKRKILTGDEDVTIKKKKKKKKVLKKATSDDDADSGDSTDVYPPTASSYKTKLTRTDNGWVETDTQVVTDDDS